MTDKCLHVDKLEGLLTLGIIGGVKVPFLKPSQLKPSNHLGKEKSES